jgi:hypothetical protein
LAPPSPGRDRGREDGAGCIRANLGLQDAGEWLQVPLG